MTLEIFCPKIMNEKISILSLLLLKMNFLSKERLNYTFFCQKHSFYNLSKDLNVLMFVPCFSHINQMECNQNEPTTAVSTDTVMACATYCFTLVACFWMYEKFILHVTISLNRNNNRNSRTKTYFHIEFHIHKVVCIYYKGTKFSWIL